MNISAEFDYVKEYARYLNDPIYAIESLLEVFDMTQGGMVKYRLFEQQKEFVKNLHHNRMNIVAKARQTGASTTFAAYQAIQIALCSEKMPEKILIIANNFDTASEIYEKIKSFCAMIPAWVWGDNYDYSKKEDGHIKGKGSTKKTTFCNGCMIYAKATSKNAGRGIAATSVVIDEAAFIEVGASILASLIATTSTGGKMTLISTPNGRDEIYYKNYASALKGENNFKITEFRWYKDKRYNYDLEWVKYDEDGKEIDRIKEVNFNYDGFKDMIRKGFSPTSTWYRDMKSSFNHDRQKIAQELDIEFSGSAGNVIDDRTIKYYKNQIVIDPIKKFGKNDNAWMWKDVIEGNKYVAGVDVSTGTGKDFSTISIFDIDKMELVFEFRGKVRPEELALLVKEYCGMYNALSVVDTTGGYADVTIKDLINMGFSDLLYYDKFDEDIKNVYKRESENRKVKKYGFKIQKYRVPAIGKYVSLIENKLITIPSIRTISEWETFIWKNNRADHQTGFNDDLIMSQVMPLWVVETIYNKIDSASKVEDVIRNTWLGIQFNIQDKDIQKRKQNKKRTDYRQPNDPTGMWGNLFL